MRRTGELPGRRRSLPFDSGTGAPQPPRPDTASVVPPPRRLTMAAVTQPAAQSTSADGQSKGMFTKVSEILIHPSPYFSSLSAQSRTLSLVG